MTNKYMLRDNFYKILSFNENDNFHFTTEIDKNHDIFNGHFPGMPIVPGVCMIGILRELCEDILNLKLRIGECKDVKFLSLVDPSENNEIHFKINIENKNEKYLVKTIAENSEVTCFKFSGLMFNDDIEKDKK